MSKNSQPKLIQTKRLVLNQISTEDFGVFASILRDKELTEFLPKGEPYSEEEIIEFFLERLTHWKSGFGTFAISKKEDQNITVGYVGIEMVEGTEYKDIRYAILKDHSGKGLAFEAAEACLVDFFKQFPNETVFGVVYPDNSSSIRILEKLGMKPEKEINPYKSENVLNFSISQH